MVVSNNVFILFEEIDNMHGGMKNKLGKIPKMINGQQSMENDRMVMYMVGLNIRDVGWLQ